MPASKAQQKATNKYISKAYDRINLTVPKGQKDIIQSHAEHQGESVNGFIGRAITETIERDTEAPPQSTKAVALLSPDALEVVQNATEITGEAVPEFVTRAVTSQAKRDETARRMGLNPVTGSKLG